MTDEPLSVVGWVHPRDGAEWVDLPGEPLPEGPEEPTTDPITEDDPNVQHESPEEPA